MRTTFLDTYSMFYPTDSGLFLRTFSGYYICPPCRRPPCPPCRFIPLVRPRNQLFASFPSEDFVLNSINHGNQNQTSEADDKEANIKDIMIPMTLSLPNLVEPYQVLSSNSHIPYSQHYPLYHFWRKPFGHLD